MLLMQESDGLCTKQRHAAVQTLLAQLDGLPRQRRASGDAEPRSVPL